MSGRIKDEDVTYLRERVPIDEVVADYVQLKSAGGGQKKSDRDDAVEPFAARLVDRGKHSRTG